MTKYLWNIGSNSSPIIQGQAGKPFYHNRGPIIRFPSDSASINNSCLCSYKYYRYYKIYATLKKSSDSLTFYTLDENGDPERLDPYEEGVQGFLSYDTFLKDGYEWRVSSSYQYLGCFPKGAFECGVWKPIAGFLYTHSDSAHPSPQYIWKETDHPGASILYMIVNSYKCCNRYEGCGTVIDAQLEDPWLDMEGYYCQGTFQASLTASDSVVLQLLSRECVRGHQQQKVDWRTCSEAQVRVYNWISSFSESFTSLGSDSQCQECYYELPGLAKQAVLDTLPDCVQWRLWYAMGGKCSTEAFRVPCRYEDEHSDSYYVHMIVMDLYTPQPGAPYIPPSIWGAGEGALPAAAHREELRKVCPPFQWNSPVWYYWKAYPLDEEIDEEQAPVLVNQNQWDNKPQGCYITDGTVIAVHDLQCVLPCCSLRSLQEELDCITQLTGSNSFLSQSLSRDSMKLPCNTPYPPRDLYIDFDYTKFNVWRMELTLDTPGGEDENCYDIWQFPQDSDGKLIWEYLDSGRDYEVYNYLPPQFIQKEDFQHNLIMELTLVVASDSAPPENIQQLKERPLLGDIPAYEQGGQSFYRGANKCGGIWQAYADCDGKRLLEKASFGCGYWRYLGQLTDTQLEEHKVCLQKWQFSTVNNTFSSQQAGPIGSFVYTIQTPYNVTDLCTQFPSCRQDPMTILVKGSQNFRLQIAMPLHVATFKYKEFFLDCSNSGRGRVTTSSQWKLLKRLFDPLEDCQSYYYMPTGFLQRFLQEPVLDEDAPNSYAPWGNVQPVSSQGCNPPFNETDLPSLISVQVNQQGVIVPGKSKRIESNALQDTHSNCVIYYVHPIESGWENVWGDNSNSGTGYCNKLFFRGLQSDSFSLSIPRIQWADACYEGKFGVVMYLVTLPGSRDCIPVQDIDPQDGPRMYLDKPPLGVQAIQKYMQQCGQFSIQPIQFLADSSDSFYRLYPGVTASDAYSLPDIGFYTTKQAFKKEDFIDQGYTRGLRTLGIKLDEWEPQIQGDTATGPGPGEYLVYVLSGKIDPCWRYVQVPWKCIESTLPSVPAYFLGLIPLNEVGCTPGWDGPSYQYDTAAVCQQDVPCLFDRMQKAGDIRVDYLPIISSCNSSDSGVTGDGYYWGMASGNTPAGLTPVARLKGLQITAPSGASDSPGKAQISLDIFPVSRDYRALCDGFERGLYVTQDTLAGHTPGAQLYFISALVGPDQYGVLQKTPCCNENMKAPQKASISFKPLYQYSNSSQLAPYRALFDAVKSRNLYQVYVPSKLAAGEYDNYDAYRAWMAGHWKRQLIEYGISSYYIKDYVKSTWNQLTIQQGNADVQFIGNAVSGARWYHNTQQNWKDPDPQGQYSDEYSYSGTDILDSFYLAGNNIIQISGNTPQSVNKCAVSGCTYPYAFKADIFPGIHFYQQLIDTPPVYPYQEYMCCAASDSNCTGRKVVLLPQLTSDSQLVSIVFSYNWEYSDSHPPYCWLPDSRQVPCDSPLCQDGGCFEEDGHCYIPVDVEVSCSNSQYWDGDQPLCNLTQGQAWRKSCHATFTGVYVMGPAPTTWFI